MGNKLILPILGPCLLIILFWGQNKMSERNFATDENITLNCSVISSNDSFALITDTTIGKTCMDCHADLFSQKIKHTTETGKECEDCHKGNGSEHPKTGVVAFSLIDTVPNLCLSCHSEIKDKYAQSRLVHQPVNDKKSCVYCHSPHSSTEKKLLVSSRKDLCLSCHNKTIASKNHTISNIEQQYKNSKVIHPPFKKCSASCHNPHASDNYLFLNDAFPEDQYAVGNSDNYALCFGCHNIDLLQEPKTNSTDFRNGETNLHYVHVNKEKGRSCILCHSPHATNNENLIRDKTRFGNFEFNMNYQSDSLGGSCSPGCHVEKKYQR